jgi:N6-adenosine-specific RNA methylase IME4
MRRYKEDVRTALPKLPTGRYKTLYVDPPWNWMRGGHGPDVRKRSVLTGRTNYSSVGATPYVGMSTKDLLALAPQIKRVAAADSHLYLWTVNKTVPDAARLVEAWGYRWVTMITWDKGRPGIAKYFQGVTEHCIFAARGSVPYKFVDGKMAQGRTLISERMTDHSRKPAAMREIIECVSYGPYLELFARCNPSRKWDAVGLELEALQQ